MKKTLALILSVLMVVSVVSFGSFSVAAETTTLIEKGSDWNYWWTDDAAAELPAGWSAADFDASDWDCGQAPFGNVYFGDRVTELNAAKSLFVLDFEVADATALNAITMQIRYDENPVIYINGTEVWSATNYHDGSYLTVDLSDKASAFVDGTNRIAIYLENLMGGYCFDMSLEGGTPDAVDADGNVAVKSADKTGFYDWGNINAATNILDGVVGSCSGSGRNKDVEQSWTVTFYANIAVNEIYLQTKGVEDGKTTSHEDGITFGYYNVYVGETLVEENAPAISEADGGYTITLETPVTGTTVKVELTGDWYADNWANLADIAIKGEVAGDAPVVPEGPAQITIFPYSDSLKGWENWNGATQLYICTTNSEATVTDDSVFEITLSDGTNTKTITAKRSSCYDWGADSYTINRFTVCLFEGDNQFIPTIDTAYTVSVKIYNDGELTYVAEETEGWYNAFEPMVPTTPEPPVDPEPPVEPDEPDVPQTGDAAIYATIAVAVAAVALAVVFKKRTTI